MIARKALPLLVVLLAARFAGACGRGPGVRSAPPPPAGPADITAMRALLERYSPTSHYIVSTYEALPTHFDLGGGATIDVSHSKGFADFFDDGAPENLVDYMSTAVHEIDHAYTDSMAYQLVVDTKAPRGDGVEAIYTDQQPTLVTFGPRYPAREMDATFPADARTSRYEVYVSPSQESHTTQQNGAYGLLDEFNAYYHDARTIVDFWPWVRDEAPASEQLLVTYISRLHEIWVPYAELELYILHYLLYARSHHPDVYQTLITNQSFRRAFAATDAAYAALLATAEELEPTVHSFAKSRGVDAPHDIRDPAYPAVLRHLASDPYQQILAELR